MTVDLLLTPDSCALCDSDVVEPLTCYVCHLSVCAACSKTDGAGDTICHQCAGDMRFFLNSEDPDAGMQNGETPVPVAG